MKNINIIKTGLVAIFAAMALSVTACEKTTTIEKDVTVNPDGGVSQTTTVDKNVSTSVDTSNGVVVETEVKH